MFIRTRQKQDNGNFVERTSEAESYNKVIHRQGNDIAYTVLWEPKNTNHLKRFWVSSDPELEPPEDMDRCHEIYVMNDNGKTIEVIS